METNNNNHTETMTPAMRMYENHKRHVLKHQKKHPEKVNEKVRRYIKKLKAEAPEKYEAMILQKQRDYYQRVVKPKREAKTEEERLKKMKQEEEAVTDNK